MTEVLSIAGLDVENSDHLSVIDGGPYLNEIGIEEFGTEDGYVRQTTVNVSKVVGLVSLLLREPPS